MLIESPPSIRRNLARRFFSVANKVLGLSYEKQVRYGLLQRPHYAYCIFHAADLAQRLNIPRISIIEFGVAGGNGLVSIERIIDLLKSTTDIKTDFEVYGFDTGKGLPEFETYADLPYWFRPSQYQMDIDRLKSQLTYTKLVIGNIRDTIGSFFDSYCPAPVGTMLIDVDYYSSTIDCLTIFDRPGYDKYFLPRIHLYFDDIIGQELEMYGPFNGMLRAIEESNNKRDDVKIHLNQNLIPRSHIGYRYQIYYAHLFKHSRYLDFIGGEDKVVSESRLRLKV